MKYVRKFLHPAIAIAVALLGAIPAALAHPMGNFSINHYARITPDTGNVSILYVIDMAEIPTVTEKPRVDALGPDVYLEQQGDALAAALTLTVDGRAAPLQVVNRSMAFRPGAGGLQTLRMAFDLTAPIGSGAGTHTIAYRDGNYPGRTGWKEIVLTAHAGLAVSGTSLTSPDRTQALTHYPSLLTTPPQDIAADFHVEPSAVGAQSVTSTGLSGTVSAGASEAKASMGASATPRDAFTEAIAKRHLTPAVMFVGLLLAFVFGAFHALSPGHGKAMVAAYLVGSRGTVKHAFVLGAIVTITHTVGVFALGLVTLFASQYIVPEKLYPILSAISGLAVFGVGAWLLYSRAIAMATAGHGHTHDHPHSHDAGHSHFHEDAGVHHDHDHDHSHGAHGHDHVHRHDHGDHAHDHVTQAHDHDHVDDHFQDHSHGVHGHDHDHSHGVHGHDHVHMHEHGEHAHDHGHGHSHGFGGRHHHHHVPEGPITLRSLLALGISGGIVPCPSALVVLLSAIALHRIAYGLALISAFSLGLASVLIAIGVIVVSASHWFQRMPTSALVMRVMPVFSATAITVIGIVLVVRAFGPGAM